MADAALPPATTASRRPTGIGATANDAADTAEDTLTPVSRHPTAPLGSSPAGPNDAPGVTADDPAAAAQTPLDNPAADPTDPANGDIDPVTRKPTRAPTGMSNIQNDIDPVTGNPRRPSTRGTSLPDSDPEKGLSNSLVKDTPGIKAPIRRSWMCRNAAALTFFLIFFIFTCIVAGLISRHFNSGLLWRYNWKWAIWILLVNIILRLLFYIMVCILTRRDNRDAKSAARLESFDTLLWLMHLVSIILAFGLMIRVKPSVETIYDEFCWWIVRYYSDHHEELKAVMNERHLWAGLERCANRTIGDVNAFSNLGVRPPI